MSSMKSFPDESESEIATVLNEEVESRDYAARLASLRKDGWIIESVAVGKRNSQWIIRARKQKKVLMQGDLL